MAVFRVEKTKNYTVMSNYHLRDQNLTLKAKGLLSLMLSLPDNWDYSTEGLAHICREGIDAVCSAVNELEKQGYVTRIRIRDKKGRLSCSEYVIHEQPPKAEKSRERQGKPKAENPVLEEPVLEEPVLKKPKMENPVLGNPVLEKPISDNPILDSPAQLSTEEHNKNQKSIDSFNIHPSIDHKLAAEDRTVHPHESNKCHSDNMDMPDVMESCRRIIHENIEYDTLIEDYELERIDEFVQIMLDAVCSQGSTIKIGYSAEYPLEMVKNRFLKLGYFHIKYVIRCMDKNTTKVRNIKNYLLAALYNSYTTIDNYYSAEVKHDIKSN